MAEEILVADREMVTLAELAPLTGQFLNYYDDLQELAGAMQRFEKKTVSLPLNSTLWNVQSSSPNRVRLLLQRVTTLTATRD